MEIPVLFRPTPVVAALALLTLLSPLGAAQYGQPPSLTVQVAFDDLGDDGILSPETEVANGLMTVQVTVPPATLCPAGFDVLLRMKEQPSYATTVISEPRLRVPSVLPGVAPEPHTLHSRLSVAITREAPAFHDAIYRLDAEVNAPGPSGGCLLGDASARGVAAIKNGYVPGVAIGAARQGHEGLTGWLELPIANLANGPTRVQAVASPKDPSAFLAIHVTDLVLESRVVSGEYADHEGVLRLRYQLAQSGAYPLTLAVEGRHDFGKGETDKQLLELLAIGELEETGERPQEAAAEAGIPTIPSLGWFASALVAAAGLLLRGGRRT